MLQTEGCRADSAFCWRGPRGSKADGAPSSKPVNGLVGLRSSGDQFLRYHDVDADVAIHQLSDPEVPGHRHDRVGLAAR